MSIESHKNTHEYDFLFMSEEEKRTRAAALISNKELKLDDYLKNKSILVWAARNAWDAISGEHVGIGKMIDTKLQDLLAQDTLKIDFFLGFLKDNAEMVRNPNELNSIINGQDTIACYNIPDGIYRINIFNIDRFNERLNTFSESERRLWMDWCVDQPPDEGIMYHPVTDSTNCLLGIKIFYQGHRNRCHIRTITREEIRLSIETGKKISIDDYKIL